MVKITLIEKRFSDETLNKIFLIYRNEFFYEIYLVVKCLCEDNQKFITVKWTIIPAHGNKISVAIHTHKYKLYLYMLVVYLQIRKSRGRYKQTYKHTYTDREMGEGRRRKREII